MCRAAIKRGTGDGKDGSSSTRSRTNATGRAFGLIFGGDVDVLYISRFCIHRLSAYRQRIGKKKSVTAGRKSKPSGCATSGMMFSISKTAGIGTSARKSNLQRSPCSAIRFRDCRTQFVIAVFGRRHQRSASEFATDESVQLAETSRNFGYVGGAPGKVNLYVGKTAVKFNIPEAEAVDRLKDLIR